MGQAARIAAAVRAAKEAARPQVEWLGCAVCGNDYPVAGPYRTPQVERLQVCQRCCLADLATLMRRNYETVRMLPTVRVLMGKEPIDASYPPAELAPVV